MLRGVHGDVMPYRDPHTAAPALWALRDHSGCDFEASVVPIEGETSWRKGMECVALALYRQEKGTSPTVNFGRMPRGYVMSSGNNAKLVATGKRFRGGCSDVTDASHQPGIPPVGSLTSDFMSETWCEHRWSAWIPLERHGEYSGAGSRGLYRIRGIGHHGLLYIGEGLIGTRLSAHLRKVVKQANQQGYAFAQFRLECSWALNDRWQKHQRLELETDLIAAFVLAEERVPPAQFIG
jgi:hypothetical protein